MIVASLRSISQLDSTEKLTELQEAIRESVNDPGRFKNEEEKLMLLGDKFASAPSTFKFSFGEKILLNDAVKMAKQILHEYSKQYTFIHQTEKRKSSVRLDESLKKRPHVDNGLSVVRVVAQSAVACAMNLVVKVAAKSAVTVAATATSLQPITPTSTTESTNTGVHEAAISTSLPLTRKGKPFMRIL